jgi:hypothetical protein
MDVITKFLDKYSYRFPKGYPDLTDPADKKLMHELLSEIGIIEMNLKEIGNTNYDQVIKNALNVEEIPQVQGPGGDEGYKLGDDITLSGEDAEIFKKLYPISPPKSGEKVGSAGSKGSGNGEIAVYWLFAHQQGHTAKDARGSGNPDLIIDDVGVEIKSLSNTEKIAIGRIGSYTESLNDLNVLMGIDALSIEFQSSGKKQTPPNSFNATVDDIIQACKHSLEIHNNNELREIGKVFNIDFISSMYNRLDKLIEKHTPKSSEELAADILKGFITQKFSSKPGIPGYIVNVSSGGNLKYTYITQVKIDNLNKDNILKNAELTQGTLVFKSGLFELN